MSKPSEKQLRVIGYIENNTNILFRGTTAEEARVFISENMGKSKQASQNQRETWQKVKEEEGFSEERDYYDETMEVHLLGSDHVY